MRLNEWLSKNSQTPRVRRMYMTQMAEDCHTSLPPVAILAGSHFHPAGTSPTKTPCSPVRCCSYGRPLRSPTGIPIWPSRPPETCWPTSMVKRPARTACSRVARTTSRKEARACGPRAWRQSLMACVATLCKGRATLRGTKASLHMFAFVLGCHDGVVWVLWAPFFFIFILNRLNLCLLLGFCLLLS